MYKLFKTSHGCLFPNLTNHFKNFKLFAHVSHLHDCRDRKLGFIVKEVEELQSLKPISGFNELESDSEVPDSLAKAEDSVVQISHPWPEWVDLMECLFKRGYFEGDGNLFRNGELGLKESKCIRTACLNFARDRYNIIRFLSRKDIKVISGCGCPSLDRKVVNSGKRLRAHVAIDEGDTCSSCNLRGDCERAYVKAREDEGGRTVDVMRFLLTYGLDPISGTVENKPCLNKMVKESVRRLLKEIVEYSNRILDSDPPKSTKLEKALIWHDSSTSPEKGPINVPMKQGDWLCPKCNFLNFARNLKCLRCDSLCQEKLKQLKEDQDHLPLKKGDWICDKCNFMNFARNTKCLQCKENPPKRQINPGEWECPSCNYINFRRNMVCLKCDHRRPNAGNSSETPENPLENGQYGYNSRSRFVRDENTDDNQPPLQHHRQYANRVADMWRYGELDGEERTIPASLNDASGFVDFPIVGGQSDLSQNAGRIDEWKLEMLERRKGTFKAKSDDDFTSVRTQRRFEISGSTDDDEEMAEWFGGGNP
ncbi:hypothetical protein UlMin_025482 [Ulmus minor]